MTSLSNLISYLLTENIGGLYEDVIEIANYPEGFDINQLKNLTSFAAKARYLKSHGLDKLGAGSSRAAFIADDNTVIKIAKNQKGLAQNKVEATLSNNAPPNAPIAIVKDQDPNYLWIESERARRAKPSDFKSLTGYSMINTMKAINERLDELRDEAPRFLSYRYVQDRNLYKKIIATDFLNNLLDIIFANQLSMGDVERISSWGVVNRNGSDHLVLIDYGLDKNVWKQHYRRY